MGKFLILELVWLLLLAALSILSVYPLYGTIANEFLQANVILAFLFAYYFRFALFFRQVPYLKFLAVQIPMFLFNPVLLVKMLNRMQEMFLLFDTNDLLYFIVPGTPSSVYAMNDAYHFFKNEFVLLAVGLLIVIAVVELRIALAFVERIRKMD